MSALEEYRKVPTMSHTWKGWNPATDEAVEFEVEMVPKPEADAAIHELEAEVKRLHALLYGDGEEDRGVSGMHAKLFAENERLKKNINGTKKQWINDLADTWEGQP